MTYDRLIAGRPDLSFTSSDSRELLGLSEAGLTYQAFDSSRASMNGVEIRAHTTLADAATADAVIVGSGIKTREIVRNDSIMSMLQFDPSRQLVGAQCSGGLVLAALGLLDGVPACTDLTTKPWVIEAGVEVLDRPFFANGNVATAGGCLASQYLAAWVIARLAGFDAAAAAMHYVAPVGEKQVYVDRAMANIEPFVTLLNRI